jgi:hypothetical protein
MGSSYVVIPLGSIAEEEYAGMRKHLAEYGLELPTDASQGRFPTQIEIEEALRSLEGYEFDFSPDAIGPDAPWDQISIFKRSPPGNKYLYQELSLLNVSRPPADKNSPCDFYFQSGNDRLNYAILERLAHKCGPLYCILCGGEAAAIFYRKQGEVCLPPSFSKEE